MCYAYFAKSLWTWRKWNSYFATHLKNQHMSTWETYKGLSTEEQTKFFITEEKPEAVAMRSFVQPEATIKARNLCKFCTKRNRCVADEWCRQLHRQCLPGKVSVESDFSIINWTKDPNSQRLKTDFSKEAILHCKQFGNLRKLFEE
jgi:hypothetical protein